MLVKDIALYLANQNAGTYDEVGNTGNIFIGVLPTSPNDCITLIDTGGFGSEPGVDAARRTVQILVRNQTLPTADSKSWEIYALLAEQLVDFNGRKMLIKAQNVPRYIGMDDNRRHEYSTNYVMWTATN